MPKASRVGESTVSTSSATITLSGAIPGLRTVSSKHTVGETGIELVIADTAGNWLEGVYTFTSATPTVMMRTAILGSSNADGDVTFPAGSKTVQETASATFLNSLSGVRSIAFNTALPFTFQGETYMPSFTMAGPLAFTVAGGAVKGAYITTQIVGDGTNTPTFASSIKDSGGGTVFDVRAGYPNKLYVWYDGFDYLRQYAQVANATPVPTPATALTLTGPTSGIVAQVSTAFSVGANGSLAGTVTWTASDAGGGGSFTQASGLTPGSFTYTPATTGAKTISITNNGGLTNPAPITYTVSAAATAPAQMAAPTATAGDTTASVTGVAPSNGGSAITGYTVTSLPAGMVDSNAGSTSLTHALTGGTNGTAYTFTMRATNAIGTSVASPPSNSVTPAAAVATYVRFGNLASVLESGSSDPRTYTGQGAGYGTAFGGVSTTSLAGDGYGSALIATVPSPGSEHMLALSSSATVVTYTSLECAFYDAASGANYVTFAAGGVTKVDAAAVARGNTDIMRIRKVGTTAYGEVSKNGGTSWLLVVTWSNVGAGVKYLHIQPSGSAAFTAGLTSGFV